MQLFTSAYYDCQLLPHFRAHYATLGVTEFIILVTRNILGACRAPRIDLSHPYLRAGCAATP